MSNLSQQELSAPCKQSSCELLIEELLPDDMGYDADVETIKPDNYEEPDSESEPEGMITPYQSWKSVDEELAARMRGLGKERLTPLRSSSNRGRKRRSVEMADGDTLLGLPRSPGIEVQELIDSGAAPSPAKRRRKKSRRPHAAEHMLRGQSETWTDSSGRGDGPSKGVHGTSTSSNTPGQPVPRTDNDDDDDDDEMMDVA